MGIALKVLAKTLPERFPVQILVGVATIQMRCVKTEVDRGSMRTVIGHGLAGPKMRNSLNYAGIAPVSR